MGATMLTLYDFGNSVCCQKVRITMRAKGGLAKVGSLIEQRVFWSCLSLKFAAAIFVQRGFAGSHLPTTPLIALPLQAWPPSTYKPNLSSIGLASSRYLPRPV